MAGAASAETLRQGGSFVSFSRTGIRLEEPERGLGQQMGVAAYGDHPGLAAGETPPEAARPPTHRPHLTALG